MAAFRDVGSFFKYAANDDLGTANPIAARISWEAIRGVSQSGNFTRQYIYSGMNQDEANRVVHEGAWPQIAGRRVAEQRPLGPTRWRPRALPARQRGRAVVGRLSRPVRDLPASSIFHRCNLTGTCPKVIEHFGGSEVFALKMTMEWVGPAADFDIPLTRNVRRYYIGSTTHGGGAGGFTWQPNPTGVSCPGNNWGTGNFRANPMPSTQMINVIRVALRAWLMTGALPPPSRYPTLVGGTLVDPTRAAMGFPANVPGRARVDLRSDQFHLPGVRLRLGPAIQPRRRRPACRPTCRRPSTRSSR